MSDQHEMPLVGNPDIQGSERLDEALVESERAWVKRKVKQGQVCAFSDIFTVTPERAKALLETNHANRHLSAPNIQRIASDIRAGRFTTNGESLIVSKEGLLNDGQHRLYAVIETGIAIETFITFGVDRDSRYTLDTGRKRTVGDQLTLKGKGYGSTQGAIARRIMAFAETGKVDGHSNLSQSAVSEFVENTPEILASAIIASGKGSNIASPAILGFCHFHMVRWHNGRSEAANFFIRKLRLGDELSARHPIYQCREELRTNKSLSDARKVELILKSFALFTANKKGVQIKTDGTLPGWVRR